MIENDKRAPEEQRLIDEWREYFKDKPDERLKKDIEVCKKIYELIVWGLADEVLREDTLKSVASLKTTRILYATQMAAEQILRERAKQECHNQK